MDPFLAQLYRNMYVVAYDIVLIGKKVEKAIKAIMQREHELNRMMQVEKKKKKRRR